MIDLMKKIKKAGITNSKQLVETNLKQETLDMDLTKRVKTILDMIRNKKRNSHNIFVYVIYDVSDSKIRNHISKYLQRNGLIRVQLSVFFGDITRELFNEIKQVLTKINDMYENSDSIFIIPIGEDILNKTTVIGVNVDFEIIAETKTTLFI